MTRPLTDEELEHVRVNVMEEQAAWPLACVEALLATIDALRSECHLLKSGVFTDVIKNECRELQDRADGAWGKANEQSVAREKAERQAGAMRHLLMRLVEANDEDAVNLGQFLLDTEIAIGDAGSDLFTEAQVRKIAKDAWIDGQNYGRDYGGSYVSDELALEHIIARVKEHK